MIGIDSENVNGELQQFELLRRHIRYIRNHHLWKQSHIVFIPERGTGLSHTAMGNMCESFPNLTVFKQKEDINGVIVTGRTKRIYQMNMVDALWDGSIRFDRDLFTVSKGKEKRLEAEDVILMLREQMERFHWDLKAAGNAHQSDRWAMTGKMGEKQDDALMAFLMCYTWAKAIQTEAQYEPIRNRIHGHRLGHVETVTDFVMRAFQSMKNTPSPTQTKEINETNPSAISIDKKLGEMENKRVNRDTGNQQSVWELEEARKNKRMRGDPNTLTDMTHHDRNAMEATTKRLRLDPLRD